MYSKTFYWIVEHGLQVASTIGATCIFYDKKLRLFYITTTARRNFYIVCALLSLSWAFCILRTLHIHFKGNSQRDTTICCLFTLLITLFSGAALAVTPKTRDLMFLMTLVLRFAANFQRKYIPNFSRRNYPTGIKLEAFVCLVTCVISGAAPTILFIVIIVFRDLPLLPHTLLPEKLQSWWMVLVPEYLTFFCFGNIFGACATLHACVIPVYYATFTPLIKREFHTNLKPSEYRTAGTLRDMENLLAEYRQVEYLHKRAMHVYSWSMLHLQAFSGQFILYCNFTLIRHRSQMGSFLILFVILVALIVLCLWGFSLEAAGRFHKDALNVINSWKFMTHKNPLESKLMSKYRKRFRPLCISAFDVFKIKRLSVLKFLRGIVKGTFRALLTLS